MEQLGAAFARYATLKDKPQAEILRASEDSKVRTYNAMEGEDDGTNIRCFECRNKGVIAYYDDETGRIAFRDCTCRGNRITVRRLKRAGIYDSIKAKRFSTFKTDTPTQQAMKRAASDFVQDDSARCLAFFGQSGCGKTHLCTAAFSSLVRIRGLDGEYFLWNTDARKLKAASFDDADGLYDRYKKCKLLYIDDLFKCSKGQSPSDADIRLAFELIDWRYSHNMYTIISSEMAFDRLVETDEAIAGRIKQMAGKYLVCIEPDVSKNFRMV